MLFLQEDPVTVARALASRREGTRSANVGRMLVAVKKVMLVAQKATETARVPARKSKIHGFPLPHPPLRGMQVSLFTSQGLLK